MVVLSSFLAPQEGIRHEEPNTTVYVNSREVGKGTLYITESVLSWIDSDTQQGFSLNYQHISVHAISQDKQIHPRQCLYIMVEDFSDVQLSPSTENDSENEDDEGDTPTTEMSFVPDDTTNLEAIFEAMNQCQALNPDPQDSFSDDEEDIYEDAEEDDFDIEYYEVGAGDAPYILPTEQIGGGNHQNGTEADEPMDIEAGQFEDAEEDP
ncbi:methylosome subunit pICln [Polistes fuscatus]|uniref:methylosome subunit pICln n=1 Tax=Polistes fuscatus TaxID=30207 RepID=UPI001CA922D2|nr:methylosome subunit pICln [Polistes fuscatus]XP_043489263.1 methylosome subunit pICln [Polistes fuscatus]XP_043489264.1 methylosome subunit pICln [Polistes fuscatus]XP_043489265.1 methylosome subunit pICln [Polistes fuscatus]